MLPGSMGSPLDISPLKVYTGFLYFADESLCWMISVKLVRGKATSMQFQNPDSSRAICTVQNATHQ